MKTKNLTVFAVLIMIICFLPSCAPKYSTNHEYGFFGGIMHGIVFFPFAIVAKIFGMDYGLYAENNSGFLYWIGFILGIGSLGGGASSRFK
jgi:hypothetical protein